MKKKYTDELLEHGLGNEMVHFEFVEIFFFSFAYVFTPVNSITV